MQAQVSSMLLPTLMSAATIFCVGFFSVVILLCMKSVPQLNQQIRNSSISWRKRYIGFFLSVQLVGNQDQQKQKEEAEARVRELQSENRELKTESDNKEKRLNELESQVRVEKEQLRKLRLDVNIMIRNILQGVSF